MVKMTKETQINFDHPLTMRVYIVFALIFIGFQNFGSNEAQELKLTPYKPIYFKTRNYGCKVPCWERCFRFNGYYYDRLYDMIYQLRNFRSARNIYGTAFLIDSTESSYWRWWYQRLLSAILAMTLPVQNNEWECGKQVKCNPFFVCQHFEYETA